MIRTRSVIMFCLVMVFCFGSMTSVSIAGMARKIVLFHEEVTTLQIEEFVWDWENENVSLFKSMPFVNGIVLNVPDSITSEELADNDLVLSVENDQAVDLQAVRAAADGGSADGGSADGGSADGGSADGGSANGGSGRCIETVSAKPKKNYRSWAIAKLHDQLYDPSEAMADFNKKDVPKSIKKAKGKSTIKIAIFDTGVAVHHERLHRSLRKVVKGGVDLINVPEGVEMSELVHIDDQIPEDDNGHGTHVIGLVAGRNIGLGTDFDLYSVKILDEYAMGDLSTIITGLQWAIENDIDIVNMSIGFRKDSPAVRQAVKKAHEAGIIMVASAGNHSNWDAPAPNSAADGGSADGGSADGGSADGGSADGGSADGGSADGGSADGGSADGGSADGGSADGGSADGGSADGGSADGGSADGGSADGGSADGGSADGGSASGDSGNAGLSTETDLPWYSVMYPARYPEVIAVGSSDAYGEMTGFTNFDDNLDILAPGTDIVSSDLGNGFGTANGTSLSSPIVAAAIAMMIAHDRKLDSNLTSMEQIKSILIETADPTSSGVGDLNLIDAFDEVDILNNN